MRSILRPFILFFLLTPVPALASGDYVLTALLIDVVLFIVILIAISQLQLKWTGKLVLFAVYFATMIVLFYLIDRVNYLANLTMINLASAIIPPTVVYVGYLQIKDRFAKPSKG
jgi:hypothetical protein